LLLDGLNYSVLFAAGSMSKRKARRRQRKHFLAIRARQIEPAIEQIGINAALTTSASWK